MKHYWRNYTLLFADTALFVNAMAFLSITTVIPYFLDNLGAGTLEVSLASALTSIGSFIAQPIFSGWAVSLKKKSNTFAKILSVQRAFFLMIILLIPVVTSFSHRVMIVVFLAGWGLFNFFVGSYSPFYMSIMPKIIPADQRGRLFGYSGAAGNIIGLGAAYVVSIMLKNIAFPYNYVYIFGAGIFLLWIDVLVFVFMKEPLDDVVGQRTSYFKYISSIPKVLKSNKKYTSLVACYCFFIISNVSLVYYTLYAIRQFNAGAGEVGVFTAISVGANILGSVVLGIVADRFGHKFSLQISAVLGGLSGIVILFTNSIYGVYGAFALSILCSCGYNLSSGIFIVSHSPKGQIPVLVSINMMITLVIYSIVTLASSPIIDLISFKPVFLITGAAGFMAFLVLYVLYNRIKIDNQN